MTALSRIDKFFNDPFFADPFAGMMRPGNMTTSWQPSIDVRETAEQLVVNVEVPGIPPDQIDASIAGNVLTVKGEKSREVRKTDEDGRDRLLERSYGSFSRRIRLPATVDPESVHAKAEHGVLTITMAKTNLPRKIDIQLE